LGTRWDVLLWLAIAMQGLGQQRGRAVAMKDINGVHFGLHLDSKPALTAHLASVSKLPDAAAHAIDHGVVLARVARVRRFSYSNLEFHSSTVIAITSAFLLMRS
jgi:hypothetical protein